jgi:hypothetical protein
MARTVKVFLVQQSEEVGILKVVLPGEGQQLDDGFFGPELLEIEQALSSTAR